MNKSSVSSICKPKSTNSNGNILSGSRREKLVKKFLGNLELNFNATNAHGDALAKHENNSQDDYCSNNETAISNNDELENYDEDDEYDNDNETNLDYENDLNNDEDEDDEAEQDALYEEEDPIVQVNCNSKIGELFKKKFGSGGKGKCIRVVVKNKVKQKGNEEEVEQEEEKWFTPIEFESFCGKANCRDWKKTIRSGGQPLLTLIEKEVLICHAVSCSCSVCCENSNINGPIKPLIKMRQRKKSEAKMVDAYKKFLNLKPPTLLFTSSSNKNSLLNLINAENSENCNQMSFQDASFQLAKDINEEEEDRDESISNIDSNFDEELISNLRKFQKQQQDQWRSIESSTNILFSEMESLKKRIDDAKQQSNLYMDNLIDKIIETSNKNVRNCKKRKI